MEPATSKEPTVGFITTLPAVPSRGRIPDEVDEAGGRFNGAASADIERAIGEIGEVARARILKRSLPVPHPADELVNLLKKHELFEPARRQDILTALTGESHVREAVRQKENVDDLRLYGDVLNCCTGTQAKSARVLIEGLLEGGGKDAHYESHRTMLSLVRAYLPHTEKNIQPLINLWMRAFTNWGKEDVELLLNLARARSGQAQDRNNWYAPSRWGPKIDVCAMTDVGTETRLCPVIERAVRHLGFPNSYIEPHANFRDAPIWQIVFD